MIYILKWVIYIPRFVFVLFFHLLFYIINVVLFFEIPSWNEYKRESYEANNFIPEYLPNYDYEVIKEEKFLETIKRWLKNKYY
jgi:hypothetical protein